MKEAKAESNEDAWQGGATLTALPGVPLQVRQAEGASMPIIDSCRPEPYTYEEKERKAMLIQSGEQRDNSRFRDHPESAE